jgi:hypothetical protein
MMVCRMELTSKLAALQPMTGLNPVVKLSP